MRVLPFLTLIFPLLLAQAARGEIVVVTSQAGAGRPIELKRNQVEALFLGRTTTLPDGTPVKLVDLPPGPIRDDFYLKLTGKNPAQIRAYWSRQVFTGRATPPREAQSLNEALQWLGETPHVIGYLPSGEAAPRLYVVLRLP
ncbi:hypothetical protein [Zoogloea sp.]|uniref:hypothetical protein n=1 Tax=Zoogloea sp. TaxID=49181 RepID=UPI00261027A7|nr:hypothetical protein [Zoogloea sp.]MDD3353182.1 hypothetical protein [Zoogloea sp.]